MRLKRSFCSSVFSTVCLLLMGIALTIGCSKGETKKRAEPKTESVVQEMNIQTDKEEPAKKEDNSKDEKEPEVGTLPFGSDADDDSAAPSLNAPG